MKLVPTTVLAVALLASVATSSAIASGVVRTDMIVLKPSESVMRVDVYLPRESSSTVALKLVLRYYTAPEFEWRRVDSLAIRRLPRGSKVLRLRLRRDGDDRGKATVLYSKSRGGKRLSESATFSPESFVT